MRLKTVKFFLGRKSSFIFSWPHEEKGWNKPADDLRNWGRVLVQQEWERDILKTVNICIGSAEVKMNASCSANISGAPTCSSRGKWCPDQWCSIRAASGRTDYRARLTVRPDSQVVLNIRPLFLCSLKTHEFKRTSAGNWEPEKKRNGEYAAFHDNVLMIVRESSWYSQGIGEKKNEPRPLAHTIPKS